MVIAAVQARLAPLLARTSALRDAVHTAWRQLTQPAAAASVTERLEVLEQAAERAKQRLAKATRKFVDDEIDKTAYGELCRQEPADLAAAERELARLQALAPPPARDLPDLEAALAPLGGWAAALRVADVVAQRETLRVLIEYIIPIRLGRGHYEAQIAWTPLGEQLLAAAEQGA